MVLDNTPKSRSTRSQGHYTRQQQPSFSLGSVVNGDPKYIGPSNRLTEAWVKEQQATFPANLIKLKTEAKVTEHRIQHIYQIGEEVTENLAAFGVTSK
ncbi:hypothetical protein CDEST_09472 [Colletotrichum destructivum]|uniref:Uncharacterized protein n=1 Tax=Colletotrichum destructivum TaxID=34406 RepID=A0AAX4INW9_9PEZI|nr:hypothetical protein CDEST_09472 [Colletotrichum destructivum]